MKGTFIDFLELAAEKPELAKELAELAGRYEFEFAPWDELSHSELDSVAGGRDVMGDLFGVFREGIDTAYTDKKAMMEKLAAAQAASDALGDYLKNINEGLSDLL